MLLTQRPAINGGSPLPERRRTGEHSNRLVHHMDVSAQTSYLRRFVGSLRFSAPFLIGMFLFSAVCTAVCAERELSIPSLYPDEAPFLAAIAKERLKENPSLRVTGISTPHHLLAADLIARGFWAASGNVYDRVIIISPDHFSVSRRPFATTRADFETPLGEIRNDAAATSALLDNLSQFEESELFKHEHGVAALLPFVKHFFPGARVIPVVVSYSATRSDWDAAVALLKPYIGPTTLVVQSTDYSHYLPVDVAIARDQQSLNAIASEDVDMIAGLIQPEHLDSKGAQYIQMRLQREVNNAHAVVVANRNSSEYSAIGKATTSYVVTVYSQAPEAAARLRYDDQEIAYFGGDVFIGRWLTQPMAEPEIAKGVVSLIMDITAGAPLVFNLEGALLDDPPFGLDPDLHAMDARLALPILKALNPKAASVANNHSHDLGEGGYRQSLTILRRAGITPLEHMKISSLGQLGLIAVNFIGVHDYKGYPVVESPADLQSICAMRARSPLVAFVHWGKEYRRVAESSEYEFARALNDCGVNMIIGAHSHQAAPSIETTQGGNALMAFSLGNFLFDQSQASSALLELRVFRQGTFAARLIKLPNLFELATGELAPKATDVQSRSPGPP